MTNSKIKSNHIRIFLLLSFVLMVVTLGGCARERILKKYYLLEPSMSGVLADSVQYRTMPYSVLVDAFSVRPAFKSKRIVLRSKSNEIQYYVYHLWGDSPDLGLRYFVWRRLTALHLFRTISMELGNYAPDYLIGGTIDMIEREEPGLYTKKAIAHVKMTLALKEFASGKIVVEYSFDRTAPLPKKSGMNDFVATVNNILNHEVDVFIARMVSTLNQAKK
jgi:ABC-type uncharacterized transport system auxiliary subunit